VGGLLKRLGVIGSMVWDTIYGRDPAQPAIEEWGGIAYALAALASFGISPSGLWVPAVAAGTLASLALLALFYLPWLTIGVGIDLVMLWLVLVTSWSPEGLAR